MSICLKCKKELEDNAKFCSECGAKVSHVTSCPHCSKKINAEFAFCPYCGESVKINASEEERKNVQLHIDKKIIKIGSSAVAAVLVMVLVVSLIIGAVSKENYMFYIKHRELFSANMRNLKSWQVSEEFAGSADFDNDQIKNYASYFPNYVKISKDKKSVFYVDHLEGMDQFSLYHQKINSNKEPRRIAKDITTFKISEEGDCVSYMREDGSLYWDDFTDRKKVASDVTRFYMSGDGKMFLYLTREGDGYYHTIGEEKQKIDGEIINFSHVSDDLKTVYYLKSNELYKKVLGKDAVLLSSDVKQVVKVYESGEIYYLKGADTTVNLEDYVEDDMLEADATTEPLVIPTYPNSSDYATEEEYEAAYDEYVQTFSAYQQAIEKNMYKETREELRTIGLAGRTVDIPEKQLCYFDGKKEHIVAEKVAGYENFAEENAAVIYSVYNDSEVDKVKFSDIKNSYNIENMVRQAFASNTNYYIAVKDKASEINQQGVCFFDISAQADSIYILAEKPQEPGEDEVVVQTDSTNQYDLYQIKISGQKLGKSKKIDSNVYHSIYVTDDNHYVYYKKVKENEQKADMYMDGKKVESDVRLNAVKYDKDTGTLWYMVDWEEKIQYGTLKKYTGEKITKVSDEVYHYEVLPDGEVLYLYNYSTEIYEGELYLYKKNKSRKVDEEVIVIIPIQENE